MDVRQTIADVHQSFGGVWVEGNATGSSAATGTERNLLPDVAMTRSSEAVEATLALWPYLELDEAAVALHVEVLRITPGDLRVYGTHVCLAVACASGGTNAIRILESNFMGSARAALRKLHGASDFADEALQVLRERLFVGSKPRIGTYAGRGSLPGWLRRAAVHVGLNLAQTESASRRRELQELASSEELQADMSAHQAMAQEAFDAAIARLLVQDRELLRRHAHGQTIDQLAAFFGLHRATVARKLAAHREWLSSVVLESFRTHFGMTPHEARVELSQIALEIDATRSLVVPMPILPGEPMLRTDQHRVDATRQAQACQ